MQDRETTSKDVSTSKDNSDTKRQPIVAIDFCRAAELIFADLSCACIGVDLKDRVPSHGSLDYYELVGSFERLLKVRNHVVCFHAAVECIGISVHKIRKVWPRQAQLEEFYSANKMSGIELTKTYLDIEIEEPIHQPSHLVDDLFDAVVTYDKDGKWVKQWMNDSVRITECIRPLICNYAPVHEFHIAVELCGVDVVKIRSTWPSEERLKNIREYLKRHDERELLKEIAEKQAQLAKVRARGLAIDKSSNESEKRRSDASNESETGVKRAKN